jgi:hypothetical protein
MSCYFRHINDVLAEAGIVVTKENKKDVDRLVHAYLDVEYKDCPTTWKAFKEKVRDDVKARKKFIAYMKKNHRG